jgi:hypothetical protein
LSANSAFHRWVTKEESNVIFKLAYSRGHGNGSVWS